MATTMNDVRSALNPDEPDYAKASRLGPDALRHLKELVIGDDPMMAAKAAHLAGLIGTDGSAEIVRIAAQSTNPTLRVAAAGAAPHLGQHDAASKILSGLVADRDLGVCRIALGAVGPWASDELRGQVKSLTEEAPQPAIRSYAKKALRSITAGAPAPRAAAKPKRKPASPKQSKSAKASRPRK